MEKITYGDFVVDFDTLPAASQAAMVSRGVTHYLGNEQASKLAAWVQGEGQANSEDRAVTRAWKEANPEAVAAKTAELTKAAFEKLLAGEVGIRAASGPRATPLDSAKRQIAKREVLAILAAANIKAPKKDELVKFADGREKSLEDMIATRLGHAEHGPRIEKEATKLIADQAKKIKAVQETAEAGLTEL